MKEDEEKRKEELDLFNIQPRRANWDLKRDMTRRMAKLDRKTNEALTALFRARIQTLQKSQAQEGGEDLLAGINAAEAERDNERQQDDDSDSE